MNTNKNPMRTPLPAIAVALFTLSGAEGAQAGDAPFRIPPNGKPEQMAVTCEFEAPTAMAFDSQNRPYLVNNRHVKSFGLIRTLRNGKWITLSCVEALNAAQVKAPRKDDSQAHGELVFDDADGLYATIGDALVYSPDLGKTFRAYPCAGSLEVRSGHNQLTGPPAIVLKTEMTRVPNAEWARPCTVSVLIPQKTADGLTLGEPILITEKGIAAGSGGHSGGTSFAVTLGRFTHLVYSQMPNKLDGGNPVHIATIDRQLRSVIAKKFLARAGPKSPDIHTRPTLTADSKGYLHVLSGSHGQPFLYLRSQKPNDIKSGWTEPVTLTDRQCYASLVCDGRDNLFSAFRQWMPHATLGYQSKAAGSDKWQAAQTLVQGALKPGVYNYANFRHRLFKDRNSTLYVSFTFYEHETYDKGVYPEALAVSDDRGRSWRLADTQAFRQ